MIYRCSSEDKLEVCCPESAYFNILADKGDAFEICFWVVNDSGFKWDDDTCLKICFGKSWGLDSIELGGVGSGQARKLNLYIRCEGVAFDGVGLWAVTDGKGRILDPSGLLSIALVDRVAEVPVFADQVLEAARDILSPPSLVMGSYSSLAELDWVHVKPPPSPRSSDFDWVSEAGSAIIESEDFWLVRPQMEDFAEDFHSAFEDFEALDLKVPCSSPEYGWEDLML